MLILGGYSLLIQVLIFETSGPTEKEVKISRNGAPGNLEVVFKLQYSRAQQVSRCNVLKCGIPNIQISWFI